MSNEQYLSFLEDILGIPVITRTLLPSETEQCLRDMGGIPLKPRQPIAMRNKITGELRPVNLVDQEIHDPRWAWERVYETEGDETE